MPRDEPLFSGFDVEFRADTTGEFRLLNFRWQHPGQEKQSPGLHRFHINTERLRRCREIDTEFLQPLFGADWPRVFAGYHLPTCEPPSTCSTSPVTWPASVR